MQKIYNRILLDIYQPQLYINCLTKTYNNLTITRKRTLLYQMINYNKKYRVGGMVKLNSVSMNTNQVSFIITDFNKEISVTYSGILPNLFVEGQGAVVEGNLISRKTFVGTKILAKHDENYMPKEVADSLKKIGNF